MIRVIIICLALSACASGGGSPLPEITMDDAFASVTNPGVTPLSVLPDSGSHRYQGLMQLDLPVGTRPRTAYTGDFVMTVAISTSAVSVTGDARGFAAQDGTHLGGALSFVGGALDRTADPDLDYQLSAELEGTLTDAGTAYALRAEVWADFYGMDADGIAGVIARGSIRAGDDYNDFNGRLAGERAP